MLTYNHEKYIKQAINSVLMQKTDFPFDLIIGDDYSFDDTRRICSDYENEYPDKINVIYNNQNLGILKNYINTFYKCNGVYTALLSGDDYWIDEYKLQKQYDFLEKNPDYGLVHTDFNRYYMEYNKIQEAVLRSAKKRKRLEGNIYEDLLRFNPICASTVMIRKTLLKEAIFETDLLNNNWTSEDIPIWLYSAQKLKIGFLNDLTTVYRVNSNSASSLKFITKENVDKSLNVRNYFIERYGASNETKTYIQRLYFKKLMRVGLITKDNSIAKSSIKQLSMFTDRNTFIEKIVFKLLYILSFNYITWCIVSFFYKKKRALKVWRI